MQNYIQSDSDITSAEKWYQLLPRKLQSKDNIMVIIGFDKFRNQWSCFTALCEVFDRADITRDGTISIAEYTALCEEYGVLLDDDDIESIQELADSDGEVLNVLKLIIIYIILFASRYTK